MVKALVYIACYKKIQYFQQLFFLDKCRYTLDIDAIQ